MQSLTIGRFQLHRPLGTGGMGMVWYATHVQQDVPVAVKVMTAKKARNEGSQRAFRAEVRAVARLNHAGVIRVFDSGQVPRSAEELTDGQMVAGSPFLAMELANSSLSDVVPGAVRWGHVRLILMHILDALAHSHARGLIHRDLKPGNILLVSDLHESDLHESDPDKFDSKDEADIRLKLADFGLAQAINISAGQSGEERVIAGTPKYMAPEQISGSVRQQGPWTDLYALGCLARWLVAGAAPFVADTIEDVLRGHLHEPVPPMEPRLEVPDGFDLWVKRLLAKRPQNRFRRAADAAFALARLDAGAAADVYTLVTTDDDGDEAQQTVMIDDGPTHLLEQLHIEQGRPPALPTSAMEVEIPPVPTTWRYGEPVPETLQLVGVGLGLFELRQIRLVGRERERDRLWQNLADARHTERMHVTILQGPRGIGKTRLATWLAERGHELGSIDVLQASHSPISNVADGISTMLANDLQCVGLDRQAIVEQLRADFADDGPLDADDLHQCMALTEIIAPGADPNYDEADARIQFSTPRERYVVLRRFLARRCRTRPLLLHLDDVHWGYETLEFVRFLLQTPTEQALPIFVVMTVRDDLLDDYPLAERTLEAIADHAMVETLDIESLSDRHHRELIHDLLGLESELAAEVAERTAGNPLFAIQLVGDWVERGILEIGPRGFRLRADAEAALPETIHQLLTQRIEKIVDQSLDEAAGDALQALEIAAIMGREVRFREWKKACQCGGLTIDSQWVEKLVDQSLARLEENRWLFVHGALRESLERLAAESNRLRRHHRHCGQMMESLYGEMDAAQPRLARHWMAAGEHERALEPLIRSIHRYRITGEYDAAQAFVKMHEHTSQRLGIGDEDQRTIKARLAKCRLLVAQQKYDDAVALLDDIEPLCRAHDWPLSLSLVFVRRSGIARMRGKIDEALQYARRGLAIQEAEQADEYIVKTRSSIAQLLCFTGELEQSLKLARQAERHFRDRDDGNWHFVSLSRLSLVHMRLENFTEANHFLQQALQQAEAAGNHEGIAECLNSLGEIHRFQGDFAAAEEYYRRSLNVLHRIGIERDLVGLINLGLTMMEQGKFIESGPLMELALSEAIDTDRPGYVAVAYMAILPVFAARADWEGLAHHVHQAQKYMESHKYIDADLARTSQWGAEMALEAGQSEMAKKCFRLSLQQWRELGKQERVDAIEKILSE